MRGSNNMETWRKELHSRNIIKHFGVLGMKWGVRRYQKENGEYTKAGLERYRQAESKYDSAHAKYKETKAKYKRGEASKEDVKNAKSDRKSALKSMKSEYRGLKEDKYTDEGDRILKNDPEGNKTVLNTIGKAVVLNVGSAVAGNIIRNNFGGSATGVNALKAIGTGQFLADLYLIGSLNSKENRRKYAEDRHDAEIRPRNMKRQEKINQLDKDYKNKRRGNESYITFKDKWEKKNGKIPEYMIDHNKISIDERINTWRNRHKK